MKEEEIIQGLIRGDPRVQTKFYNDMYHRFMGYLLKIDTKLDLSTREEIISDAFLSIFKNIHKFKIGNSFISWCFVVLKYRLYDTIKLKFTHIEKGERVRNHKIYSLCDYDESIAIDSKIEHSLDFEIVMKIAKSSLSQYQFHIFEKTLEGYTSKELSKTLFRTKQTIDHNKRQNIKNLKKLKL